MELRKYMPILWRHWLEIALTLISSVVFAGLGSKMMTPVYEASVTLQFASPVLDTPEQGRYDIDYASQVMNTYAYFAESTIVGNQLQEQFGLSDSIAIDAEILPNSELMKLTVEAGASSLANDLAHALANILVSKSVEAVNSEFQKRVDELNRQIEFVENDIATAEQQLAASDQQSQENSQSLVIIRENILQKQGLRDDLQMERESLRARAVVQTGLLSVFDQSAPSTGPTKPHLLLNMFLGLVAGLVAGLGLALLLENLDSRLHSLEQIEEATQMPLLACIPVIQKLNGPKAIVNEKSPESIAYSKLAMNLIAQTTAERSAILMVTSSEPGEGTSSIVTNLAITLAKFGKTVTAVDCNLHRPSLHTIFGLCNDIGVSDILCGHTDADSVFQSTSTPNLRMISSGQPISQPSEPFTSGSLNAFMARLQSQCDIVVVDAPPLLASADSLALSKAVDAVVFVVGQSIAHKEAVELARDELANSTATLLGVVVSRATQQLTYSYREAKDNAKS